MDSTFSDKESYPDDNYIKENRISYKTTASLDEVIITLNIKEGFLHKKTTGLLKRWVIRYFVLEHMTLKYFYDKNQKKQGGIISFDNLQVSAYLKSNKIYLIITSSKRYFKLKAENDELAKSWYLEINSQIQLASNKLKKKDLKFRLNFTFTTSNSQIFFVY